MVLEVDDVESAYRRIVERGLPIQKELSRQSWGHNCFCIKEPNGLTIYLISRQGRSWLADEAVSLGCVRSASSAPTRSFRRRWR